MFRICSPARRQGRYHNSAAYIWLLTLKLKWSQIQWVFSHGTQVLCPIQVSNSCWPKQRLWDWNTGHFSEAILWSATAVGRALSHPHVQHWNGTDQLCHEILVIFSTLNHPGSLLLSDDDDDDDGDEHQMLFLGLTPRRIGLGMSMSKRQGTLDVLEVKPERLYWGLDEYRQGKKEYVCGERYWARRRFMLNTTEVI